MESGSRIPKLLQLQCRLAGLETLGGIMIRRSLVAAAAVLALGTGALTPAASAVPTAEEDDAGRFGVQDPSFDGVYRQGLAISGMVAVDRKVPDSSVTWLSNQQCGDGSFQAYRNDLLAACDPGDPEAFTGPDTNSTAMAAMALAVVGKSKPSKRAVAWLREVQNPDGGFPYIGGGLSDANSTGLALAAIRGSRVSDNNKQALKQGKKFLKKTQLRCEAGKSARGQLSYQKSPKSANLLASAQGALGLLTQLPVAATAQASDGGAIKCGEEASKPKLVGGLLASLKKQLKKNDGMLPSSFGDGVDSSATAYALLAFKSSDRYGKQVKAALAALQDEAPVYTETDGQPDAGALGTLLLVAGATNENPKKFGGVNLVKQLKASLQ